MKFALAFFTIAAMAAFSPSNVHAQRDTAGALLPEDPAHAVINVDLNVETEQGRRPLITLAGLPDCLAGPCPPKTARNAPLEGGTLSVLPPSPDHSSRNDNEDMSNECRSLARQLGKELKMFIKDSRKTATDIGAFLKIVGQKRAEMKSKLEAAGC